MAQAQYSLVSRGPTQRDIKAACDDLGIRLISYSPLGLGLLSGKYDASTNDLPTGPRGLLFRQILPGLQPLVEEMRSIAAARKKTVPQVPALSLSLDRAFFVESAYSLQTRSFPGLVPRTCASPNINNSDCTQ